MSTARLEAFSDGVIAILITIMVLELKVPARRRPGSAARRSLPVFLTYVLSFVYLGIYWNNHHHMLHATRHGQRRDPVGQPAPAVLAVADPVRAPAGWARTTSQPLPTAIYGVVLLMAAIAYYILQQTIIAARAPTRGWRRPSAATARARLPWSSTPPPIRSPSSTSGSPTRIYVFVALMWLVPDRRIENVITRSVGQVSPPTPGR